MTPNASKPKPQTLDAVARRWPVGLLCALGVCVAAAAAVRVWAAQDELWLDEIWTLLSLGRNNNSLLDILTAHHDNNHYLITFWMYFTSPQRNWFVYRIPSVLAGVGTVILSARAAARWGNRAALVAAILTGASFMMIFYASEARGYALAGFFALLAFLAIDRYLDRREPWLAAIFGLATILGTLSHLTFVQFYAGALAWSVFALTSRKPSSHTELAPLIALHIVPASFLIMLYAFDVREMKFGGGDAYVMHDMVLNACALAVGTFGAAQPIVWGSVGLGLIAAVAALVLLWREKSDVWIFFLVAFLITPALLLGVKPPPVLHERYFYLNILFFLILLSYLFDRVAARGRAAFYVAATVLLLFVLANANLTYQFLRVGRGHFLDALAYMAEHSRGTDVLMSGDAEFTYRLYTEFYTPYVPGEHQFQILTIVPEMAIEPEWVILNNQDQPYTPKPAILDSKGNEAFTLERVFPYAGLSGAHFAIYHRTTMRNAASQAQE